MFKHDFFAATVLYEAADAETLASKRVSATESGCSGSAGRDNVPWRLKPVSAAGFQRATESSARYIVVKLGRKQDFLGLPLAWLGRELSRHELSILGDLQDLSYVPKLLGRINDLGFAYEYIPGSSLDERPHLPDDFFDKLANLVTRIHRRKIACIDLNKRGNILLGDDNLPHLIDFQISCRFDWTGPGLRGLGKFLLEICCQEDFYHIGKHKRHLCRHLMSDEEIEASRRKSPVIQLHRKLTRPLICLRRRMLWYIFRSGGLDLNDVDTRHPESNPQRWAGTKPKKEDIPAKEATSSLATGSG